MTLHNRGSNQKPKSLSQAKRKHIRMGRPEESAVVPRYGFSLASMIGLEPQDPVHWSVRRRIMQILRKATRVMGPGQKSKVGRLGGGAAIGALVASFSAPALAQYSAGGGAATGTSSVAIGSGTSATHINGVAMGTSNTATGTGAVAIGNNNTVDTFAAPNTITDNGILDRATGGTFNFPNGAASQQGAGVALGQSNVIDAAGIAIGSNNQANHATNVTLAIGLGNHTSGAYGSAIGVGNLASGSSSIAVGVANIASNNTAIAMGRQSTASGQTSIAIGNVTTANQTNAIAIGHSSQATSAGAVAIGGGTGGASTNLDATAAQASAVNAVAIGTNAEAVGVSSLALGNASRGTGINGSAFGASAQANADNSTALGSSSVANGISATAIGHSNTAGGNFSTAIGMGSSTAAAATNSFAAGRTANAGGASSVAIGHDVVASAADTVAIGHSSSAVGPGSVSIGLGQTSTGEGAVAIGDPNIANGQGALAIGRNNTAAGNLAGTSAASGAVALGNTNRAIGQGAIAIGRTSDALAAGALAIGDTAVAGQAGAVALGSGSVTAAAHTGSFTINGGTVAAPSTAVTRTVSVGAAGSERQIQNVAAGVVSATSTDAINGSQLYLTELATNNLGDSIETITGAGLVLGVDGLIVTAPSFTVAGGTQTNVGAAFDALDDANTLANTGIATAIGGGMAIAANGTVTQPTLNVNGTSFSTVSEALTAAGAGFNFTTSANGTGVANGTSVSGVGAGETHALTAGNNIVTTQSGNDVAIALNPVLTGVTSLAVTSGATISGTGIDMNGDGITGLAAGSTASGSTDAVNGGQLNTGLASVATNTGGGSVYDPVTGTVTAPTITVGGSAYANMTDAIEAGDAKADTANTGLADALGGGAAVAADGTVTAPTYALSGTTYDNVGDALAAIDSGAVGLVQQVGGAPGTGNLTVGAATGGTVVDFTGTDGARNLTGVLAGATTAASTDAVNGGQINTLGSSIATNTGGGSTYDPVTGTVTAPAFTVAGGNQSNVGAAFDALNTANDTANTGIASAVGGGMAIAADGTVTAPSVTVGTTNYSNLTDAIEAAGAGFNLTTAATGSGVANGTSVEGIAAGETVTLTAGNNIITTQVGNETQVALNPALTGITSLDVTGGPTISGTGIDMAGDKITNLGAGSTAPGSTDAVNGGQINTGLGSVATNLGGGATYDPVTGVVSAPGYAIDGTTFNNVGDALAALAADSKYVDFNSALAAASATGTNASAIGPNAQAVGNNATAVGVNSNASGNTSLALGSAANASGNNAIAQGTSANASGTNALALGANSNASGTNSVALGSGSQAGTANAGWTGTTFAGVTQSNNVTANGVVSVSGGSTNRQITGVADGAVNATSTDAISGSQLFAVGTALDAKTTNIGTGLASSLGGGAAVAANGTVTAPAYALSGTTYDNVGDALAAIDSGEVGLVKQVGGAPGAGDLTVGADTGSTLVNFTGTAGDRVLTGVAAGSTAAGSTDAVNGSQLNLQAASVAAHLGGGATYNSATGVVTTPNYVIAGTTYNDVGSALGSLAAGGAKQKYFNANSTLVDSTAVGVDSVAIGPNAVSTNAGDVALGDGAISAAPNSGAFTLNGGTVAAISPTSVLSIGAAGTERQIQNVAAGVVSATSTDAINGSQLFTVATAANNLGDSLETVMGGGLTLNPDGTIATPAAISVGGVTYANASDAIEASDAKANLANAGLADALGGGAAVAPDGTVSAPAYNLSGSSYTDVGSALTALASGGAGPVQYADAATPTTPNGGMPSQNLTLVGAATGPVTLDNVAPGSLAAGSTQAVNGGQVNSLGSSVATQLGAGSSFDPVTGQVTAPAFTVAGGTQANVGAALDVLDDANLLSNSGISSVIGGGMAIAADGTVTAPAVNVNGTSYGNLTDAIQAAGSGFNLTTAARGSGVANGTSVAQIGAGETSTVTAGNNIVTTQNGNEVEIALNSTLVGIDSLSVTSGPTLSGVGIEMAGDSITNLGAGSVAIGSTDAVNGGQLNAGLASVATNFGGGSTFDPLTGMVTAPAISVGGASFANVTDAIEASDSKADTGFADAAAALGGGSVYDPATGNISNPNYSIGGTSYANVGDALDAIDEGRAGLVRQAGGAPGTGQITVGAETGGTALSVAGTDGDRVVSGIAAGAVSVASTDAINGAQLFASLQTGAAATDALGASTAANLGGTSVYDPVTDTVNGLAISVAGTTETTVTDAIQALDASNMASNSGLAAALGGGAAVGPDGTVTAPAYAIQGSTYSNVGSALGAIDGNLASILNGTAGLVQQAGGSPGTGQITVGAATGGTSLSVSGTDGDRIVTGVLAGSLTSTSTDAVNGSQVNGLANSLATVIGGSSFDPITGQVTTPGFTVQGSNYGDIASALGAVNTNVTNLNHAMSGGGIKYFHANSTQADSAPIGMDSVAIGPVSGAGGDRSISIGLNSNAAGTQSIAIGTGNSVTGANSGAIGDPNTITGSGSYALGNDNVINANNAFVVGNNVTIAAGNNGSVGLGNNTTVAAPSTGAKSINGGTIAANSPTSVVSVGSAGGERQITNVAAGVVSATSTDAINGSQLFAVGNAVNRQGTGLAAALGGGAAVAPDGIVTGPTYTVAGGTQTNVGEALSALDGAVTGITNGTAGLVQQTGGAPGSGSITIGAGTGGTIIEVAGTEGSRVVTGVAPASLAVTSVDAVNGGQLNTVAASAAAALGGGSLFDPATGHVTAPSYTIGGVSYGNVGDALAAGNKLAVQYVPDAAGAPTNAIVLGNNSSPVSVSNVAPGAVNARSRDAVNGSQLYTVQQAAEAGVQYVRNPDGSLNRSALTLGTPGTPTQVRNVAAGVAPTDAVNVGQLQAGLAGGLVSANSYTDARIAGVAFDLRNVAKRAYAGSAAAIALQAPALFEPGQTVMRGGVGAYRGQWALGLSVRATADNGRWSLSGGISGGPNAGVAASAGIDFVLGD